MAEERKKARDHARAIDAKALMRRAQRRLLLKIALQALFWGILILAVVGIFKCLNALSEYETETELPTRSQPLDQP